MPDKKPTDAEIVKALECCISGDCDNCHYDEQTACNEYMKQDALDLINRLQADVDNYKQIAENQQKIILDKAFENKNLKAYIQNNGSGWGLVSHLEFCKNLKAEAYKKCIEKVKEEIKQALESNYKARNEREKKDINLYLDDLFWNYCSGKIDCLRGLDDFLDNLLKEMVGEDNG